MTDPTKPAQPEVTASTPATFLLENNVHDETIVVVMDCADPEEALRLAAATFTGGGIELFDDDQLHARRSWLRTDPCDHPADGDRHDWHLGEADRPGEGARAGFVVTVIGDGEAFCRVCGCTASRACPGGCVWVPDPELLGDLCSTCAPALPPAGGVA